MTTTTVLNDDTATIVSDDVPAARRFSWSAAFAGAFVATAVTLLLLTLGSGVGLSLVTVRHATANGAITFLSLGAVYFLVAQAFGFAAGGHIVGRMIGPALETDREEEFRAGIHGLVSWALAVVATASLIALSVVATGAAATSGAVDSALASTVPAARGDSSTVSPATAYYVDTLFRTSPTESASAAWRQYAQVDTGTATDGTTAPPSADSTTITPEQSTALTPSAPAGASKPASRPAPVVMMGGDTSPAPTPTTVITSTRSIGADKAEAARILTIGMADGGRLSSEDHTQLAALVARDTGLTLGGAQSRVTEVENRIREDETKAAELARKTAAYASLWTAFALLFGAVVAVAASISARWQDDKEQGVLPGTRVSEVRF
jgi:hypothetical protein